VRSRNSRASSVLRETGGETHEENAIKDAKRRRATNPCTVAGLKGEKLAEAVHGGFRTPQKRHDEKPMLM